MSALRQRGSRSRDDRLSFDDVEMVHRVELTCPCGHALERLDGGFQWTIALAAGSVTIICGCLVALAGGVPA